MLRAATIAEHPQAFELLFRDAGNDRQARVDNALRLVRTGEFDSAGIFVATHGTEIMGAIICQTLRGASSLVWPPQSRRNDIEIEDQLMKHATHWLQSKGCKLAQSLLAADEVAWAKPLSRNGFRHITSLWFERHFLDVPASVLAADRQLVWETYSQADRATFAQTLLATYDGTQDCPELNGIRTIEEILQGHEAQGIHDPERWWLARYRGRPAGVLLLTAMHEPSTWELCYLGVVPETRGRGFGLALASKAMIEAKAAEVRQLTLSVDARNLAAWNLYRRLGFETFDQREVFLAIWPNQH